jgi:PAS domain S-box-containing protein
MLLAGNDVVALKNYMMRIKTAEEAQSHACALFSREIFVHNMRGIPVPVEIAAQPASRADGSMLLIGSARDISGARLMRNNLKRNQALLSGLLNSIPDIIFYSDNNGEYLGCNRAFCELVGKSEDAIIGSTDYDLFPGDKARQYQAEDRYMLETGTAKRVEETLCYADGRRIEVETVISPYYSAEGEALGVVGVSRDITEQRNMLRAIHERERRYHNLVEAMHDTIMRITPAGSFVFISPNFKRLTGYEPSQGLGRSIVDLMTGDDFAQLIADVARKAGVQAGATDLSETVFRCADGGRIEVELSISSEHEESGRLTGRIIVARNVRERRQIERALLKARDEAENANRAKSAFLASMSHELKTPLNSIMGYCQLLERRKGDSLDDKLLDYVRIIRDNGQHLTALIQDILDFSKLEADRCELELAPVALNVLFDKVAAAMRPIWNRNSNSCRHLEAEQDACRLTKGACGRFDQSVPRGEIFTGRQYCRPDCRRRSKPVDIYRQR